MMPLSATSGEHFSQDAGAADFLPARAVARKASSPFSRSRRTQKADGGVTIITAKICPECVKVHADRRKTARSFRTDGKRFALLVSIQNVRAADTSIRVRSEQLTATLLDGWAKSGTAQNASRMHMQTSKMSKKQVCIVDVPKQLKNYHFLVSTNPGNGVPALSESSKSTF